MGSSIKIWTQLSCYLRAKIFKLEKFEVHVKMLGIQGLNKSCSLRVTLQYWWSISCCPASLAGWSFSMDGTFDSEVKLDETVFPEAEWLIGPFVFRIQNQEMVPVMDGWRQRDVIRTNLAGANSQRNDEMKL
ncbi:hypothetical protein Ancab_033317 [Ancistrocladus abbreviatus]